MRFSTTPHKVYRGIDRHARTMSCCVLNQDGAVLLHRNLQATPAPFLRAIAPYRQDRVVCVGCLFTWDLARRPMCLRGQPLRPRPRPLHVGHPRRQGSTRYAQGPHDRRAASWRDAPPGLCRSRGEACHTGPAPAPRSCASATLRRANRTWLAEGNNTAGARR